MKYLIAGLGNIGQEYELSRHNIGFVVIDQLADKFDAQFTSCRFADKAEFKYKGRSIHLIKPTTYMNLSGKAVSYWLQELKVPNENFLVVVDDLAIPFESIRIRPKGSAAGHNGLTSIEELTGGQNYPRLRVGIGSNFGKGYQVDYVLSNFTKQEFEKIPTIIEKSMDAILSFCTIGLERTMNQFNN
jgi:PTH1 family peptidyl-tRNA hydrolase